MNIAKKICSGDHPRPEERSDLSPGLGAEDNIAEDRPLPAKGGRNTNREDTPWTCCDRTRDCFIIGIDMRFIPTVLELFII